MQTQGVPNSPFQGLSEYTPDTPTSGTPPHSLPSKRHPPPPAAAPPPRGSPGPTKAPAALQQFSQPVFFKAGRQALLFAMGLARPAPQGGPAQAPNVPPGRAGTITTVAWEGEYGRDQVLTISSLYAAVLHEGAVFSVQVRNPPPPLALRAHLVTMGQWLRAIHRVAPKAPKNFVPFAGDPRLQPPLHW